LGADCVAGVMLIPFSIAVLLVTDRLALAETIPLAEAVTVVIPPALTPVAIPVALSIVATAESPVAQVT